MSDEKKVVDATDSPADAEAVTLQKQIDDLKMSLQGKDSQISDLEAIKTQLVEARNSLKKREDDALAEQGKYKELYEKATTDFIALKGEHETTKTEVEQARTRLKEIEDAERTRLLALLPDGERDEFKDFAIPQLQKVVKLAGIDDKGGSHRGAGHKPSPSNGGTKWSEMSDADRVEKARILSTEEIAKLIQAG